MTKYIQLSIAAVALAAVLAVAHNAGSSSSEPPRSGHFLPPNEEATLLVAARTEQGARNRLLSYYYRTDKLDRAAKLLLEVGDDDELFLFFSNWLPSRHNCLPEASTDVLPQLSRLPGLSKEVVRFGTESAARPVEHSCPPEVETEARKWVGYFGERIPRQ